VLAQHLGDPPDAVLSVKLRRARPWSQSAVQLFLDQPGGELSVAVKAEAPADVSERS
jgi:hypothetical protein